ncbi:Uncharacterized protein APZ42_030880 [Daphnia magna]|uniref:Uncharacterized protein n=1 Tax=Daphnia magna TaxID=35525 RepID=A0A164NEB2_9CRUS|nr:Uncharacterized protein APZ42_030880 [Daphnia magna]
MMGQFNNHNMFWNWYDGILIDAKRENKAYKNKYCWVTLEGRILVFNLLLEFGMLLTVNIFISHRTISLSKQNQFVI